MKSNKKAIRPCQGPTEGRTSRCRRSGQRRWWHCCWSWTWSGSFSPVPTTRKVNPCLHICFLLVSLGRFHQRFKISFCKRRSQKRKNDWWLESFFALSGSTCIKTSRKHVDAIDSCFPLSMNISFNLIF